MEEARDVAERMRDEGRGIILDQFASPDNPRAHYEGTAPEIWRDTGGKITHLVSSMGTTGTIMGCSRYFKEKNPEIQIIGVQPEEGSQIPGIRKWPEAYLPKIYDASRVDRIVLVSQAEAEDMTRRLATEEGIFAGISSGGALAAALKISAETETRRSFLLFATAGIVIFLQVFFPPEYRKPMCVMRPGRSVVGLQSGVQYAVHVSRDWPDE